MNFGLFILLGLDVMLFLYAGLDCLNKGQRSGAVVSFLALLAHVAAVVMYV